MQADEESVGLQLQIDHEMTLNLKREDISKLRNLNARRMILKVIV
jgi:hypothetical protein